MCIVASNCKILYQYGICEIIWYISILKKGGEGHVTVKVSLPTPLTKKPYRNCQVVELTKERHEENFLIASCPDWQIQIQGPRGCDGNWNSHSIPFHSIPHFHPSRSCSLAIPWGVGLAVQGTVEVGGIDEMPNSQLLRFHSMGSVAVGCQGSIERLPAFVLLPGKRKIWLSRVFTGVEISI